MSESKLSPNAENKEVSAFSADAIKEGNHKAPLKLTEDLDESLLSNGQDERDDALSDSAQDTFNNEKTSVPLNSQNEATILPPNSQNEATNLSQSNHNTDVTNFSQTPHSQSAIKLPHDHHEVIDNTLLAQLNDIEHFQIVSELFKQLSDSTRIRLFWLICHCEECVLNLSAMMNMSSPAISHHLRALRNKGLVSSRRVGKEVYYRAANTEQSMLLHQMIEKVLKITCPEHKN
ncbi:metalloregulator ArsR/SmtB family transcription factor [Globicatella sp. HMSC072A10]|uniref:ArsR/SmtB family transcription factor n=1 Tax=Globicatella sp. HMSC072A10 TaxID=1739315 RepID=UPI000A78C667|nr:metalloregulator ArsR/SmtB family transcription factor [Globicatella sp. HMSC072A10]